MQKENRNFDRWIRILALAWPLIIANSFWNLQLTIDRIFLGMYSTEALGAAMAVMGVFWVPMALLQQTASYLTTFVAQYYGANEQEKIGECVWQAVYVCVVGGFLFMLLNFLSPMFFDFVGHPEAVRKFEIDYFNALSPSALPTAIVAAISGFFTGLGRTRTVIWLNFTGLVLNAIFAYVMVFGKFGCPEMGVVGAGYATALASYGAAAVGLYLIYTRENDRLYKIFKSWRLNWNLMKQYLKYGIPSGLQWALEGLAFTTFLIIMGRLKNGEAALASSSIAVTVMMLSVLPSMGIAQAVMTLVGQGLGHKEPARAERATWDGIQVTCIYMVIVALTFVLIPQFYLSWFKNEENMALWAAVSEIAPKLFRIVAIFTIFDSIYLNVSFALKGAGDTRFVSLVSLIVPWPTMVLPAYLLADGDGTVVSAWAFVAVYSFAVTGILLWRFRTGRWKTMSVIGN